MILPCVEHHDETCRALAGVSRAVRATTCAMRWRHLRIVGSVQILGLLKLIQDMPNERRPVVNLFLADTDWNAKGIQPEQWISFRSRSANNLKSKVDTILGKEKKRVHKNVQDAQKVVLKAFASILQSLSGSLRKLAISTAASSRKLWLPVSLPHLEELSWHVGQADRHDRLNETEAEKMSLKAPNLTSLHLSSAWYDSILLVCWIHIPGILDLKILKLSMPHKTLYHEIDGLRKVVASMPIQDIFITIHPPRPSPGAVGIFNGTFTPEPNDANSPTAVVERAKTICSASGQRALVTYDDPLQFVRKDDVRYLADMERDKVLEDYKFRMDGKHWTERLSEEHIRKLRDEGEMVFAVLGDFTPA
jgi:hypothetical protein